MSKTRAASSTSKSGTARRAPSSAASSTQQRSAAVATETRPQITTAAYAQITRVDTERWEVEGVLTDETIDTFGTVFDYDASKRAVQEWAGNVREQHDPRKAVGRKVDVLCDDEKREIRVRVRVSRGAPETWEKVLDGTLAGFSIGAYDAQAEMQERNSKRVPVFTAYKLGEISLVDVPSNVSAFASGLTIVRATAFGEIDEQSASVFADLDSEPVAEPIAAVVESETVRAAETAAESETAAETAVASESVAESAETAESVVVETAAEPSETVAESAAPSTESTEQQRAIDSALAAQIAAIKATIDAAYAKLDELQQQAYQQAQPELDAAFGAADEASDDADALRDEAYDLSQEAYVAQAKADAMAAQANAMLAEAKLIESKAEDTLSDAIDAALSPADETADAADAASDAAVDIIADVSDALDDAAQDAVADALDDATEDAAESDDDESDDDDDDEQRDAETPAETSEAADGAERAESGESTAERAESSESTSETAEPSETAESAAESEQRAADDDAESAETAEPLVEIDLDALLAEKIDAARDLRMRGHSGACNCGGCRAVRERAIAAAEHEIEQMRTARAAATAAEPSAAESAAESDAERGITTETGLVGYDLNSESDKHVASCACEQCVAARGETSAEQRAVETPSAESAVETLVTPDAETERKGARVSTTTRGDLHAARDAVLKVCAVDCDECARAITAIEQPPAQSDGDESAESGESGESSDDATARMITATIERVIAAVERALAPTLAEITRTVASLSEQMQSFAADVETRVAPLLASAERAVELAPAEMQTVDLAPLMQPLMQPLTAQIASVEQRVAELATHAIESAKIDEIGRLVQQIAQQPLPGGPKLRAADRTLGLSAHSVLDASVAPTHLTQSDLSDAEMSVLRSLAQRGMLKSEDMIAAATALVRQG